MSKQTDNRYWEGDKETQPSLLLVRAPLTFGHTQLTMKRKQIVGPKGDKKKEKPESHVALFKRAGAEIGRAIDAMHKRLTEKLIKEFHELAFATQTRGILMKVLILRASASEKIDDDNKLKIHLVPYFQSHHDDCLSRFAQRHRKLPGSPGGLLGWIGEQEDRADEWEVDYPCKDELDKWAIETLRLPELANRLRTALKPLTAN